ncbi:MAG: hypothetical protein ACR2OE_12495 [Thermomicrobiales bacterium]
MKSGLVIDARRSRLLLEMNAEKTSSGCDPADGFDPPRLVLGGGVLDASRRSCRSQCPAPRFSGGGYGGNVMPANGFGLVSQNARSADGEPGAGRALSSPPVRWVFSSE